MRPAARIQERALPPRRAPLARQQATSPVVVPLPLDGTGPRLRGRLLIQTARLDVYAGRSTLSDDDILTLAPQIELELARAERLFGTELPARVSLGVYHPAVAEVPGSRGMAYTDSRRAEIYYRRGEHLDRALAVAVHELAHHLEVARYDTAVQRRADTLLHEGLATWIAGGPWLAQAGSASWREHARALQSRGVPLRLLKAQRYGYDQAYELWASFVDYLVQTYGMDAVDALYASGRGRTQGSADYAGVLGKPLTELADEWRAWVNAPE